MAASDLCTLANVRAFLQKETADTAQDAEINTLITSVSQQIIEYCAREFAPATANATRRFRVNNSFVDLVPYDLRNTTSGVAGITVTLNPESTTPTVLVAGTDYMIEPLNGATGGTYLEVRLSNAQTLVSSTYQNFGYALLDITADWGMSSIPADVVQAAVESVAIRLRRDVSAFSTTFSLDESRLERPEALPRSVVSALAQYRRMVV